MRHLSLAALLLVVLGGCAVQAEGEAIEDENLGSSQDELVPVIKPIPLPRPNLVAVAPDGTVPTSYYGWKLCDMDDDGFVIRVKNNGIVGSAATITVISGGGGVVALPTPALAAGETVVLHANFWSFAKCTPDCSFTITVDAASQITETDEANSFAGWCIG